MDDEQQQQPGQVEDDQPTVAADDQQQTPAVAVFTQSDVDRMITDRLRRERDKYRDYDELKAQAKSKQTADERIAALESEVEAARLETVRRRVQAAHGLSDEDADLFLVGGDEEVLTAQAKRLAGRDLAARRAGGVARLEGEQPHVNDDRLAFANFLTRN